MKQWFKGAAVVATGMMLVMSNAFAGPKPGGPPPAPSPHVGSAQKINPLNLTPAQQTKLQALTQKMLPDIQAALKNAKTEQQAHKAMMAVQTKWNPQILSILTPAQRVKFNKLRADAEKSAAAAMSRSKAMPKSK